jgi:hypothetical protein
MVRRVLRCSSRRRRLGTGRGFDAAEDDLDRLLEKVYGTLIADLGKASAEAFFPKLRGAARRRTGSPADPGADAGAPA